MTEPDRHRLSASWQTWLVLAGTAAVGRWIAGGGFGYTLFAVVWGPVASLWVPAERERRRRILGMLLVVVLFATPWWIGWPAAVALRLTGWLTLFVGCLGFIRRLGECFGATGTGGPALVWLGACAVPVLMTDRLAGDLGEGMTSHLVSLCPLVIANLSDALSGDWTHQQVAYTRLTRLGQDFPYDGAAWWGAWAYGAVGLLWLIVPRGTFRRLNMGSPALDGSPENP